MLVLALTGMTTAYAVIAYSTTQKDAQTTSTIALGSGTEYLSPELWGLMYKQLAVETVPERVRVLIVPNLVSVTPNGFALKVEVDAKINSAIPELVALPFAWATNETATDKPRTG